MSRGAPEGLKRHLKIFGPVSCSPLHRHLAVRHRLHVNARTGRDFCPAHWLHRWDADGCAGTATASDPAVPRGPEYGLSISKGACRVCQPGTRRIHSRRTSTFANRHRTATSGPLGSPHPHRHPLPPGPGRCHSPRSQPPSPQPSPLGGKLWERLEARR